VWPLVHPLCRWHSEPSKSLCASRTESPAPDAAITEFVESFGQDLPEEAVKAIRIAAKLGNKELCKALAAIAAESGMTEMEV